MNSATAIQLSVAELLAFLTLLLGVLFGIGRMLVTMVSKSLQAKLEALERTASALESEVEALNRQLPLEYVRREDWIRFSTSIDSKLDRLAIGQQSISITVERALAASQQALSVATERATGGAR